MKCEDVERYVHVFLDSELTAAESLDIQRHLEDCPQCRRLLEVEAGVTALIRDVTAREEAPEALWGKIAQRIEAEGRRVRPWERAGFGLAAPALLGSAVAILSFFLLRDYVAAGYLSPLSHAVLGVLSGGLFGGLVRLGLRGPGQVLEQRLCGRLGLGVRPLAWGALVAAISACLLLFLFPIPSVAARFLRAIVPAFGPGPPASFAEFVLLGGGYGLLGLLVGGLLVGRWVRGRVVSHALVGACLYVVVMAPALAVVCIPLTAATLLGMALGSAAGGVVGGALGIWALATG